MSATRDREALRQVRLDRFGRALLRAWVVGERRRALEADGVGYRLVSLTS